MIGNNKCKRREPINIKDWEQAVSIYIIFIDAYNITHLPKFTFYKCMFIDREKEEEKNNEKLRVNQI